MSSETGSGCNRSYMEITGCFQTDALHVSRAGTLCDLFEQCAEFQDHNLADPLPILINFSPSYVSITSPHRLRVLVQQHLLL